MEHERTVSLARVAPRAVWDDPSLRMSVSVGSSPWFDPLPPASLHASPQRRWPRARGGAPDRVDIRRSNPTSGPLDAGMRLVASQQPVLRNRDMTHDQCARSGAPPTTSTGVRGVQSWRTSRRKAASRCSSPPSSPCRTSCSSISFTLHWFAVAVGLESRTWSTSGQFPSRRLPLVLPGTIHRSGRPSRWVAAAVRPVRPRFSTCVAPAPIAVGAGRGPGRVDSRSHCLGLGGRSPGRPGPGPQLCKTLRPHVNGTIRC